MTRPARPPALVALFFVALRSGVLRFGALLFVASATLTSADDAPASKVWRARGTPALAQALSRAKPAKKEVLVGMPGGDGCCGDVPVDKGPIAEGLEKEPFLSFAAARETVFVEAPECALIAKAYNVVRPGLLLLDGDGRWLAAVSLPAVGGADLAKDAVRILTPAAGAKAEAGALARVVLSGGAPTDAQVASLTSMPGVLDAAREGSTVVVHATREFADPDAIAAALATRDAKPTSSLVLKRWRLAGLEKTMAGLAMLRAPIGVKGVLSVRPDRPNKVVALLVDSTFDEAALNAAWKETYAEASPLP